MQTNREKYREFCKKEEDLPIFSRDWWLDAVCGYDNWDVVLVEKGNEILASFPYFIEKSYIFTHITMPLHTHTMGVYIKYPKGQGYSKRLSWEKKAMDELISKLPKSDSFLQNFDYKMTNLLPFHWHDFTLIPSYSYGIENISIDKLSSSFDSARRRNIKKAKALGIVVEESDNLDKFYELNSMTYRRQGREIAYKIDFLKRVYRNCKANNSCKILFAKDSDGDVVACNLIVYDKNTLYYILGGININKKDMGGMDLVMLESIKFALESGRKFDFEGSMIEGIEKYFRSFGAKQKIYFTVSKVDSKLFKVAKTCRDLV